MMVASALHCVGVLFPLLPRVVLVRYLVRPRLLKVLPHVYALAFALMLSATFLRPCSAPFGT